MLSERIAVFIGPCELLRDVGVNIHVILTLVTRHVGHSARGQLSLALCDLAHDACTIRVGQQALAILTVSAEAMVGVVWAFGDMTLVTTRALGAEAEGSKRTTNGSGRGHVNMRITACTVRAVAAKKIRASWHAVIAHIVG